MKTLALGFIPEPITVSLERLLPSHKIAVGMGASRKYKQILASIEDVGLIEPLTIGKVDAKSGQHLLLDGHIRVMALKSLGYEDAPCLIALDDETYTYNNRLNRLSTIQEHMMIRRAVDRGVSKERLAMTLGVDISSILKMVGLLDGVCKEAAEFLKDQRFSPNISAVLRKMKPTRQIECAELMVAANSITLSYAEALLAGTPPEMLVSGTKPKKLGGLSAEQMAKMGREMGNVLEQYKLHEETYGQDVLQLTLAKGYLAKLVGNEEVRRFLKKHQPDMLDEFEVIVQTEALDK